MIIDCHIRVMLDFKTGATFNTLDNGTGTLHRQPSNVPPSSKYVMLFASHVDINTSNKSINTLNSRSVILRSKALYFGLDVRLSIFWFPHCVILDTKCWFVDKYESSIFWHLPGVQFDKKYVYICSPTVPVFLCLIYKIHWVVHRRTYEH